MKRIAFILGLLFILIPFTASSEAEKGKTLSPYFFVQSEDSSVDPFPLLETRAKVEIVGVIAEVELTQVYKNDGKRAIEAIYVFPLGTRSTIHAMRMKIGTRIIEAQIEERAAAKRIYERAKEEGKVASLLEQERPNVFQMKVANIMPKDVIEVKVNYTELLVPEDGVYEYVFPTVVGPRYSEKSADEASNNDRWVETSYLHEGQIPSSTFDIDVNIRTGIPLAKVWVPSHTVQVKKQRDTAKIALSPEEERGGNRDFILRYTLRGKTIQTGLLLYPGGQEKFFLLMLQPPEQVTIDVVPPREYVFIVDVSGSMHGFPLEISTALITGIIQKLRGEDYFNILFFAGGSNVLSPAPLPATKENKHRAVAMLQGQQGGGGTRILPALEKALSLPKQEGLSRIVVIATDGYVDVEKKVFDLMRDRLNEANFFAFGIGSSVNRYLIEGMARVGRGEPFVIGNEKEASKAAARFADYIKAPLLTDIEVTFEGFDAAEVELPHLPDLFARRPLILFGKYRGAEGTIRVHGRTASGTYKKVIAVSGVPEDEDNKALRYLWARERIARLDDYGKVGVKVKEEVTKLGLRYHLMTPYTSFVAVDTVVRDTGEVVTVKQPLPLPQGVSDYAVGGNARAKLAAAPSVSTFVKSETAKGAADYALCEEEKGHAHIYLMGGNLPAGVTMNDAERALAPLKGELQEAFEKWELERVVVLVTVERGRVKGIRVKEYEGKGYDHKALTRILQKASFPTSVTGTMELELVSM